MENDNELAQIALSKLKGGFTLVFYSNTVNVPLPSGVVNIASMHPEILTRDMGGSVRTEHLESSEAYNLSSPRKHYVPQGNRPKYGPFKPIITPHAE